MTNLQMIAQASDMTVLSEYEPDKKKRTEYQSEAELEEAFIKGLCNVGYERLIIHNEKDLLSNLRTQLEKLNKTTFSDDEWNQIYSNKISNNNLSIKEKTKIIQKDHIYELHRDNGSLLNVILIDKKEILNNQLQVINQYVEVGGNHDTRYDVTILVNGLPLVHVELKRRGAALKEAFNQINRYQRDSFWASSGLYEFVQIFVISNGTHTKYYSNTTRKSHIDEVTKRGGSSKKDFK